MRFEKMKKEEAMREREKLKRKTFGDEESGFLLPERSRRPSGIGASIVSPLMKKLNKGIQMKMSPGMKVQPMYQNKNY